MAATLTINAVPKQTAGVSFEVDATLQVAPSYQFHDDTGTFVALPAGASAPAASTPMTFTHPGLSAGTHTIALRDSVTGAAGSTSVVVTAPAPPPTGHATKYSPGQSVTTPDGHRLGLDTAGNMTWDGALIPGGGGTSFIAEDPTVGGATGTNYGEDAGSGNWWTWDTINGWVLIAPATPNFGTTSPPPPPVQGPGHGPALSTHMTNPQTVTPISDGASGPWGNVTVSAGLTIDTQTAQQYGFVTYLPMECNAPGMAEFGLPDQYKILYGGGSGNNRVVAVFYGSRKVFGAADVPFDGNIYLNSEGFTYPQYGGMIWRYAGGPANIVINDWLSSRGDVFNIRGDYQSAGVTITYPNPGDTFIQIHADGGTAYIYGHTLVASDISWAA